MANVIQLSRFRSVSQRDLRLDIPAGDSDLRPVAIVVWLASVIRTALTLVHHEAFGVEATLAFVCAVFLPFLILRARHVRDTTRQ
jgi:Flp pilus assembly protein TadB